jgi:peptidyl-prolyl cis-trans isomerase A (cyclophilin A)
VKLRIDPGGLPLKKTLIALFLTLLTVSATHAAETVTLRDGRSLTGKVIRRNQVVTVITEKGMFQFPEAEISGQSSSAETQDKKPKLPNPIVEMTTNFGVMRIELFEDDAPNTVANFIELAEKGIYEGTRFHRVIPNFMLQGGDPNSKDSNLSDDGMGGPGYRFADEFSSKRHTGLGVLSMANSGPNTNGSQFFILLAPTPHLNGKHSVFGKVIEGLDVVKAIGSTPTSGRRGNPPDRPKTDVILEKLKVISKRDHEYKVKKL